MSPLEYVKILRDHYGAAGRQYFFYHPPEVVPWTPLPKPLKECRVALLGSSGLSLKSHPPFDPEGHDDLSVREIPKDVTQDQVVINYNYVNHSDADVDLNCVFPLARLRELEAEGFIGGVCDVGLAMGIGRWFDRVPPELLPTPERRFATAERLQNEAAKEMVGRCRGMGADVALLVPT